MQIIIFDFKYLISLFLKFTFSIFKGRPIFDVFNSLISNKIVLILKRDFNFQKMVDCELTTMVDPLIFQKETLTKYFQNLKGILSISRRILSFSNIIFRYTISKIIAHCAFWVLGDPPFINIFKTKSKKLIFIFDGKP